MKIIDPSYEILSCPNGDEILALLERAGRVCYKSEDKIEPGFEICKECEGSGMVAMEQYSEMTDTIYGARLEKCFKCKGVGKIKTGKPSSHKMIKMILDKGHESVIEHSSITVKFICNRGFANELVRHRLASFSQESSRYCLYSKEKFGRQITVIRPPYWNCGEDVCKYDRWRAAMTYAEEVYLKLIKEGAKAEEARGVLPIDVKTEIVMTCNFRELRHVFKLRTSPAAHPSMRQLMIPLLEDIKKRIPILFDDIEVNEKARV